MTAGHLIRQRVLTEAKRALVFTGQPIHEISYDLGFADPSHFARFFRKQTGIDTAGVPRGQGRLVSRMRCSAQPQARLRASLTRYGGAVHR